MQAAQPVQLVVSLDAGTGPDDETIDAETRRLRSQMAELDVESVELAPAGAVPPGAKSADAAAIGTLLVTVLPTVLPKLLELVQAWTQRREGRTVKIRATAGDRSVDIEYTPRTVSQDELNDLVASVSRALNSQTGSA